MKSLFVILCLLCLASALQCEQGKKHFQIYRHYTSDAQEEFMEVYEGAATTDHLIFSATGIDRDNQLVIYDLCLNPTLHTFMAIDKGNNGWSERSYFELCTINGVQILQGTLSSYSSRSWTFQAHIPVSYSVDWWYTDSIQQGNEWTSPTFDRSSWTLSNGHQFPNSTMITRYYCTKSDLYENITSYASVDIGIYSIAGFNIYINGRHVMSRNLPTNVTGNTEPLAYDSQYSLRRRSTYIAEEFRDSKSLTVCIENHMGTLHIGSADEMKAYILLLFGPRVDRVDDGSITSDHYDDVPLEHADNAFDFSIYTQWKANSLPANIEYIFDNERVEWINSYAIWNGHNSSAYNPTSWRVWGSHAQGQYYLIDAQSDITFDSFSSPKVFYLDCNVYHFNSIKFEFLASRSGAIEVGEIRFYTAARSIQTPSLKYPSKDYHIVIEMDEIHIAPVYAGFTEFSLAGILPQGLSFNNITGIISGIATMNIAPTEFTVQAMYAPTSELFTTTFSMSTSECSLPNKRFDIMKVNSKWSNGIEEVVTLYDSHNKVLDTRIGVSYPMTEYSYQYYHYCLPQGVYRLGLTTTDIYGWGHGSRVSVLAYDDNKERYIIARRGLLKMTHDEFYFNTEFEKSVHSKALFTSPFNDATWKNYDYNDNTTFVDYAYGQYPESKSNVWFFRQLFNVTHSEHVQGYEFRIKARAGAVIYLDGKEIYRVNVNANEDINSNSVATGGSAQSGNFTWYTITGPRSSLPDGYHLFAVALIGTKESAFIKIDFSSTLRLLTETNSVSRTWSIEGSQSSSVYGTESNANRLFDQNFYNRFAAYINNLYPSPQYAIGTFKDNRREFVNAYCITNGYESAAYDPAAWNIQGSNDGTHWDNLDVQNNIVWNRRSQRQCYYMYNQNTAYNQIKLNIIRAHVVYPDNDRVVVGELQLYLYDFSQLNIPDLSYTPDKIEDYVNTPLSTILPSSNYYTNFKTEPELPSGLTIDTGTGIISGIPTIVLDRDYTITANGPKGEAKTHIHITLYECSYPKVRFYISFNDLTDDNAQDTFVLTDDQGNVIDKYDAFPTSISDITISYCEIGDLYTLTVSDSDGRGWGTASYTVYLSDMTELGNGNILRGQMKNSLTFNTEFLVYPEISYWRYHADGLMPSPLWNTVEYDDSNWNKSNPGHFENLQGITQYYRISMELPKLDSYVSYEIMVKVQGGVAAYLNGELIYKYHLPSFIVGSTPPTAVFDTPTKLYASGSIQFSTIQSGIIVFAVEVHSLKGFPETSFDGSFILNTDNKNIIVDGKPTSNIEGYKDAYIEHTIDKAFDGNVETKYVGLSDCKDHYVEWIYNYGRKEVATSLSFIRGDFDTRLPDELMLLATNDRINWDYLIWKQNITFGDYNTINGTKTYSFFNDISYNVYRLYMSKMTCREGLEVAEVELHTSKIGDYCPSVENYDAQIVGERSYMYCKTYYTGYKYRECLPSKTFGPEIRFCEVDYPLGIIYSSYQYTITLFSQFAIPQPTVMAAEYYLTISPKLPDGLSFNNQTGVISGTVYQVLADKEYSISVVNTKGVVSTRVKLSFVAPAATSITNTVIIVCLVVCAVLAILYYMYKKTKIFNFLKRDNHTHRTTSLSV